MRQPGIEPRATAWKAAMLPLHHWRLETFLKKVLSKSIRGDKPPGKNPSGSAGQSPATVVW